MADPYLLTDIRLRLKRSELRPVYTVATGERRVPKVGARLDLATTDGRDNLGQAVILRLLTHRRRTGGAGPFHFPHTPARADRPPEHRTRTRNLLKLHILESLHIERVSKR